MLGNKRGATNAVGMFIMLTIAILIVVSLLPSVITAIAGANFSGSTATILNLIPMLIGVGLLLLVARFTGMV